jgi:hypothetical protein
LERPLENYTYVGDENMVEGSRYYNGAKAPAGSNELGDCPSPSQSYEAWSGPDQRPTITYGGSSGILETRAYPNVVAHPGLMFRQVEKITTPFSTFGGVTTSTVYSRVTIVAYYNGLPAMVVYYDSLSPSVVMGSNF